MHQILLYTYQKVAFLTVVLLLHLGFFQHTRYLSLCSLHFFVSLIVLISESMSKYWNSISIFHTLLPSGLSQDESSFAVYISKGCFSNNCFYYYIWLLSTYSISFTMFITFLCLIYSSYFRIDVFILKSISILQTLLPSGLS